MSLEGVSLVPAEGKVAVAFVDDDEDDDAAQPGEPADYECCLAIVTGVGPKVTGVKKGDTVVVSPWARDGMRIGGQTIIDSYSIQATVK